MCGIDYPLSTCEASAYLRYPFSQFVRVVNSLRAFDLLDVRLACLDRVCLAQPETVQLARQLPAGDIPRRSPLDLSQRIAGSHDSSTGEVFSGDYFGRLRGSRWAVPPSKLDRAAGPLGLEAQQCGAVDRQPYRRRRSSVEASIPAE
jgi:hypothetical protein